MKTANLVIYRYRGDQWVALLPADVPGWVKEPQVIADLVTGAIVARDGEFFRAQDAGPSPILLPREKRVRVAH